MLISTCPPVSWPLSRVNVPEAIGTIPLWVPVGLEALHLTGDRGASRLKTVPCPVAATPWASEAGVVSVVAAGLQPRRPARTRVARMEYAFFICAKIEYVL